VTSRADIDGFLAEKSLAIAGVSRGGKKFGNTILKDLKEKGYTMYPVHPKASEVDGVRAYPSFAALPDDVGGVIVCVPPAEAVNVVRDAAARGIRRIWLQQGAGSPEAVSVCEQQGLSAVHGHCILMFADPSAFIHRAHRWLWQTIGKVPA
jgi:predicted CoA-binding protein